MTYREVLATLSPTHWWKLDETTGTNADDAVGTSDGTYTSTVTLNQPGLIDEGTAVELTATADAPGHIAVADHADFKGLSSMSIAMIVVLNVSLDNQGVGASTGLVTHSGTHPDITAGAWAWLEYSDQMIFSRGTGAANTEVSVTVPGGENTWELGRRYHLAMVWTGAVWRFYRDGTQVGTDQSIATIGSTSTATLKIGTLQTDIAAVDGKIDEVAYWKDTALTSTNISDLYAAMVGTTQTVLPDADTTTTGWSTAPLYSKLNDSSDATVITATLA